MGETEKTIPTNTSNEKIFEIKLIMPCRFVGYNDKESALAQFKYLMSSGKYDYLIKVEQIANKRYAKNHNFKRSASKRKK